MIILDSECRPCPVAKWLRFLLRMVISRIVFRVEVFKAERPNRRNLRDVLTGFRPARLTANLNCGAPAAIAAATGNSG